ncbi:hypothetical protein QAD02_004818 [Eretmocerus hayati]|uniref:Uncharacterized protein n=1 Tax=Eretmocerus hayati TaxID=131215 RepID=A0ACC2NSJ5_9HYME|nr:hypothetical protein QAD02_004818 [Eretmocerus hayati]
MFSPSAHKRVMKSRSLKRPRSWSSLSSIASSESEKTPQKITSTISEATIKRAENMRCDILFFSSVEEILEVTPMRNVQNDGNSSRSSSSATKETSDSSTVESFRDSRVDEIILPSDSSNIDLVSPDHFDNTNPDNIERALPSREGRVTIKDLENFEIRVKADVRSQFKALRRGIQYNMQRSFRELTTRTTNQRHGESTQPLLSLQNLLPFKKSDDFEEFDQEIQESVNKQNTLNPLLDYLRASTGPVLVANVRPTFLITLSAQCYHSNIFPILAYYHWPVLVTVGKSIGPLLALSSLLPWVP